MLDEVPNSLVPISEVGKILGIFTPAIDSIIDLASAIVKVDFRQEGRNLYNLGLHGMSAEEMIDFVS